MYERPTANRPKGTSLWFKILVVIFVLFALVCLSAFAYVSLMSIHDGGSLEEALRIRAMLEPLRNPETGVGCDPDYEFLKFANGEWVVGIGRDSHTSQLWKQIGGTVVLKDIRGQIRFFTGHVCGPKAVFSYVYGVKTLDEFYDRLNVSYVESQWP